MNVDAVAPSSSFSGLYEVVMAGTTPVKVVGTRAATRLPSSRFRGFHFIIITNIPRDSSLLNICKELIRGFVTTTTSPRSSSSSSSTSPSPPSPSPQLAMDLDNPQKKQGLFAQCSFAIVRNAGLKQDDAHSVSPVSPSEIRSLD